jgi:hypothetical protein
VLTPKGSEFAGPEARVGGEQHQSPVPRVDAGRQGGDLVVGEEAHRLGLDPRGLDASQRVPAQQLVLDRRLEETVQRSVGLGHRAGGEGPPPPADLDGEASEPPAQHQRGQLSELDLAELGQNVVADVGVVDPLRRGPEMDDRPLPLGTPRRQRHATAAGVDPGSLVQPLAGSARTLRSAVSPPVLGCAAGCRLVRNAVWCRLVRVVVGGAAGTGEVVVPGVFGDEAADAGQSR